MAGKIKQMIDSIIEQRSNGNDTVKYCVTTKLIVKGIDPEKYDSNSEDDPEVIDKLKNIAEEMQVKV